MRQLVAGIVVRVSTDFQARKGHSLDAQDRLCREYCAKKGYVNRDEFVWREEGESGGELHQRTGLMAALNAARSGHIQVVVLFEVDRGSRSGILAIGWIATELERVHCRLEFAGEDIQQGTLYGDVMLGLKASVAAEERRKVSSRTRRVFDEMTQQGKNCRFGPNPYGYRWSEEGQLMPFEPEAVVIRRIYQLAAANVSATAIRKLLNSEEVPSPAASNSKRYGYANPDRPRSCSFTWTTGTVAEIIRDPTHRGQRPIRKQRSVKVAPEEMMQRGQNGLSTAVHCVDRPKSEWAFVEVPAIIDEATWHTANATLDGRKGTTTRNQTKPALLRSLIRCGLCDLPMHPDWNGSGKRSYRCAGRRLDEPCRAEAITGAVIEEEVWSRIGVALTDPEKVLADLQKQAAQGPDPAVCRELERCRASLAALEREAKGLVRSKNTGGPVEQAVAISALADVERTHKQLTEKAADLERQLTKAAVTQERQQSLIDRLIDLALELVVITFDEKRRLLDDLGVVVKAVRPEGYPSALRRQEDGYDKQDCTGDPGSYPSAIVSLTMNIPMPDRGFSSSGRSGRRQNPVTEHRDVFTINLPLPTAV